tara:strand:+ start:566 stop:679 length:114 start_codon:yes stop_codon:yes gene_type:complete
MMEKDYNHETVTALLDKMESIAEELSKLRESLETELK